MIMGILNVTSDSFSDGNQYLKLDHAVARAHQMVEEGADMIDIGGESTRPGAMPVSLNEELDRVIPVIEKLVLESEVPLSIDTHRAEVMRAAITAGACFVNDIYALKEPDALSVVAETDVAVCLMHCQGTPQTMQVAPTYQDVVQEVTDFLSTRIQACLEVGINRSRIVIDPGFGFGKNKTHNEQLLRSLEKLQSLGQPLLVGLSRKSWIGQVLDAPVEQRLHGSIAAAVIAMMKGANIIRVHDVKATVEASRIFSTTFLAPGE